jgi:hypothetical protein
LYRPQIKLNERRRVQTSFEGLGKCVAILREVKTHTISMYYGKPPIEVTIPDDWEHDEPEWFRKPTNQEYYVSRIGLVAKFSGDVYQENPERIMVREIKQTVEV